MINRKGLSMLHYIGFCLAAVSGLIHLYLAPQIGFNFLGISFLFAGVGFFLGIALTALDYRRKVVYLFGVPFTAGQIFLWYDMNGVSLESFLSAEPLLDFIDKIAQVGLIIILLLLIYREQNH